MVSKSGAMSRKGSREGESSLNSIMGGNCYDIVIMWRRVPGEVRRLVWVEMGRK